MLTDSTLKDLTNELSKLSLAVQDLTATPNSDLAEVIKALHAHASMISPHPQSPAQQRTATLADAIPSISERLDFVHSLVVDPYKPALLTRVDALEEILLQSLPKILQFLSSLAH